MASDPANLQFERADFAEGETATAVCRFCKRAITERYFEVNGHMTCATCREAIAREQAATAGTRGVLLAIAAGLGAGFVGALLYYAVRALTGYEFALISIAVGYLVGRAVRWASGGRGGRVYQAIAVVVTYFAIAASYAPVVLSEIKKEVQSKPAVASKTAAPAVAGQQGSSNSPSKPETPQTPAVSSQTSTEPAKRPSFLGLLMAIVVLALLILAVPVLVGIQSILGLIIIGVALYEAFKITRRVRIKVDGPFTLTGREIAAANAIAG